MSSIKTAVGYARVSTTSERQETSIPTQRDRIKSYCESKGWAFKKFFQDKGSSGKDVERAGFNSLKDFIQNKKIDALIVTNLDRFSRNPRDVISEIDWLNEIGVDFVSIDQSIDTSTTTGEMVMVLISYLNRMEREKTVDKIKKSLKKKKERGEPWGRPPFGLKYSEDKSSYLPNQNFKDALEAIELREKGKSLNKVESKTGVSKSTVHRIMTRKKLYNKLENSLEK